LISGVVRFDLVSVQKTIRNVHIFPKALRTVREVFVRGQEMRSYRPLGEGNKELRQDDQQGPESVLDERERERERGRQREREREEHL
jgi:hypothetical protein